MHSTIDNVVERQYYILIMEVDIIHFYELNKTSAEHLRIMMMMKTCGISGKIHSY